MFRVTPTNGFLPAVAPLRELPAEFKSLEEVMARLPELLRAPAPDALAAAVAALPAAQLLPAVQHAAARARAGDPALLHSLMRDYSVLVSAYLLEGKTKGGAPRAVVPSNVAAPFAAVAAAVDEPMIMSYDSYCLSNCYNTREGSSGSGGDGSSAVAAGPSYAGWGWRDLRLIRAFDGGPEEATFVLVHAEIESHTPALVGAYNALFAGLGVDVGTVPADAGTPAAGSTLPVAPTTPSAAVTPAAVAQVQAGLEQLKDALERIVVSQLKMFNASDPRNYTRFVRPWIFGWRGNPDLPDGVVFEGVGGGAATHLRGETGAQSTIVPSLDAVLGLRHREDVLRVMLAELEAYRPAAHRAYLAALRQAVYGPGANVGAGGAATAAAAAVAGAETTTTSAGAAAQQPTPPPAPPHRLRDLVTAAGSPALAASFNACVGLVWAFRSIHVTFADMYIARYTDREAATGGTPYKAYLRKHRDESIAQQIDTYGPATLCAWDVPAHHVEQAHIDAALSVGTANGIPAFLLERHADLIARHGRGDPSLGAKAFPTAAAISKWGVSHGAGGQP